MSNPDYASVMEKRIKYFSSKYDPLDKYSPEWKKAILEMPVQTPDPVTKRKLTIRVSQFLNSIIAF